MKKKIFFDLSFIKKKNITGIQRFALNFVKNFKFKDNIYYILVPPKLKLNFKKKNIKILYCTNNIFINIILLNLYLIFLKVDFFFIFGFPTFFFKKKIKLVRILHDDTIFSRRPYFNSFKNSFVLFFFEKFWLKKYYKIITVSNYSKNKIKKYFHINNIFVLYNCLSNKFLKYKKKISLNAKFRNKILLCVGTINERKNYEFILKVFNRLLKYDKNYKLKIVGKYGYNYEKFNYALKKIKNSKSLQIITNSTDEELIKIYKSASVLLIPSKDEGFCIPFIEAQYFKTPVIANNLEIFREIGNINFLPINLKEKIWVKNIISLMKNKERYFAMCKKSDKNSTKYLSNKPDKIINEICK